MMNAHIFYNYLREFFRKKKQKNSGLIENLIRKK
jgi:hypothetical protein